MIKPVSPAEFDAMSSRERRRQCINERPTDASYAAAMVAFDADQAAQAERSALVRKLEAVGGKFWCAPEGGKARVYFEDVSDVHANGYFDMTRRQFVSK